MKTLIVALAMVAGTAMTGNQAQALPTATPLWACSLQAKTVHDNRFYVILKAGEVDATGTMTCVSWHGQRTSAQVNVTIQELGIGAGFAFPVENATLDILSLKAGVASPRGMYGKYSLQAGVGLNLIAQRVAVEGGVEATPYSEIGGKAQIKIEQQAGLGIDFTAGTMTISPAQR
jgi:hypothetical protein